MLVKITDKINTWYDNLNDAATLMLLAVLVVVIMAMLVASLPWNIAGIVFASLLAYIRLSSRNVVR